MSACHWILHTGPFIVPIFFLLYVAEHFLALQGEDICLDITFHVSTFEEPPAAVRFNFISLSSGSLSSYPPSLASALLLFHLHPPHMYLLETCGCFTSGTPPLPFLFSLHYHLLLLPDYTFSCIKLLLLSAPWNFFFFLIISKSNTTGWVLGLIFLYIL